MKISYDLSDLIFRAMFSLIFIGLGGEHIFSDQMIQHLMPAWMPYPRLVSMLCGVWLLFGGCLILVGWRIRQAAYGLAFFLIVVTTIVHLPSICTNPTDLPEQYVWMWQILQRSNLVKNLCLLGVCVHLLHHSLGKYSLESYLGRNVKP